MGNRRLVRTSHTLQRAVIELAREVTPATLFGDPSLLEKL